MARTQFIPTAKIAPQVRLMGTTLSFLNAALCTTLGSYVALGYDDEPGKETIFVKPNQPAEHPNVKLRVSEDKKTLTLNDFQAHYEIPTISLASNQVEEIDGEYAVRIKLGKNKRGKRNSSHA